MGIPAAEDSLGAPAIESVILIERRLLVRECFAAGLERASGYNVISFASPETYLERADRTKDGLIVLRTSGDLNDAETSRQISLLLAEDLPVVLFADGEDVSQIVKALEAGARGFIPSTLSLAVVVEALRFVRAGGTFVPASSLLASRRSFPEDAVAARPVGNGMFTSRQAAVVDALLKGKANKIIAYELNMCESTVKVHVRSIMKKLKARNRTEVAYIVNGMTSRNRLAA
jgi:DNA-binding NarL/FixJ family response regulator